MSFKAQKTQVKPITKSISTNIEVEVGKLDVIPARIPYKEGQSFALDD